MTPFKKLMASRKFWISVITAISSVVAYYRDPEMAKLITAVGLSLVGGLGLEDFGKAKAAIEYEN
jgi:hypothetical protein